MRKVAGFLALVIALGVGYYMFTHQMTSLPGGAPPQQVIDVAGVRNDLVAIAQAERLYLAEHGSYATIEQLQQAGAIAFGGANRRGYNYTVEVVGGQSFRVVATPADPEKQDWPTLSIDDTMQVKQE